MNTANKIIDDAANNLKQLQNTTLNELQTTINTLQTKTLELKDQIQTFSSNAINDIKEKSEQFGRTIS